MKPVFHFLCILLLVNIPFTAFAQKKELNHSRYIYHPSAKALTFNLGIGKVRSFTAAAAYFEREQFIGTDNYFSFIINIGAYYSGTIDPISKDGYRAKIITGLVAPGCRFHPMASKTKADIGLAVLLPTGWSYRQDELGQTAMINKYSNNGLTMSLEGQVVLNLRNMRGRIFGLFLTSGYNLVQPPRTRQYATDSRGYILAGIRFGSEWN